MLRAQPMPFSLPRTTERSDRELVEDALRDPEAFLEIFTRYKDPVHRYCHRRLGNREAAEDATQTTFMRAFTNLHSCTDRDGFRRWLFTIAHNVIVDAWRATKPVSTLDSAGSLQDSAISPEEQAIALTERLYISTQLSRLPDLQRDVVELRLQGFTDKEIAKVLGKSHDAVRAAQHRALIQLRSLMGVSPSKDSDDVA